MKEYAVIGKRLPRPDAVAKVTGNAEYTIDMTLPGMLHGKILRSPYPHARILDIDASKARKLRGVKSVITGKDTAGIKHGGLEKAPWQMDKCMLALDKARYIGDEIAAVAATSEDIAEEALDLIRVEYEVLPAVFDPEEALKPGAPLIHEDEDRKGNISAVNFWEVGEVDKALAESYYVAEDKIQTHPVIHATLEPHNVLAQFDSSGKLTVWSSTQTPYYLKRGLAKTLIMPESNIRVIKPYVGGGFGGKWEMMSLDFCASLLSIKTGLPVRIAYDREEEFTATHRKHPEIVWMKTGVSKAGKILVRDCRVLLDGGAYTVCGNITTVLSGILQSMPYRIPAYRYSGTRAFTNKQPSGAMRGHGATQVHLAADVQLDRIAERLGMDPIELRMINSLEDGDRTVMGHLLHTCGLKECLQKGADVVDWRTKRGAVRKKETQGVGVGSNGFMSGESFHLTPDVEAFSTATIKFRADGTAMLFSGAADIGQGINMILTMIAAEELGIYMEDVKLLAADTDLTPVDMGTYSSRGTMFAGNAVKITAAKIKRRLLKVAADKLEANIDDLEARDRRIFVKGNSKKSMDIAEVATIAQMQQDGCPLVETGSYLPSDVDNFASVTRSIPADAPLDVRMAFEREFSRQLTPAMSFGAHFAEVEIDQETGEINIKRFVATHDCGFALNPMAVEGQLEGTVHMGLGYALCENIVTEKGLVLNRSFLDYTILTSMDMPTIETISVESHEPMGPFGAKECGEGALNPTAPAVLSAIYDATGIRFREVPVTPAKMLAELRKMKSQKVSQETKISG